MNYLEKKRDLLRAVVFYVTNAPLMGLVDLKDGLMKLKKLEEEND
jgi:hypothetical protein